MAQRVQVLLVCDLHDEEVEGSETIGFAIDGKAYEIDVCEEHAEELRETFAEYVGAARRAGRAAAAAAPAGRRVRSAPVDREQMTAMRAWARKNGFKVSERGRLAKEVLNAYHAAH